MKLNIEIEMNEDELKRCIAAAWNKACHEELDPESIHDFTRRSERLNQTDVENLLIGSCLGEFTKKPTMTYYDK